MPFRTRNPYYLRISEKNVLPLYVYLDSRHVNWMTDNILQHVLADLQPKILPKLKAEADALSAPPTANKKATVDTHRGDSYQFCYFIRKTEPHSVLIKTRHFSAAPPQKKPDMPPPPPPRTQGSKRKGSKTSTLKSPNKRRKTKGKGKARDGDESDEAISSAEEAEEQDVIEASQPRRSQRSKQVVAGGYQNEDSDVEMEGQAENDQPEPIQIKDEMSEPRLSQPPSALYEQDAGGAAAPIDIDIELEEEKPKPVLQLRYKDFSIYGHCLCIVVEPYPPMRSVSRAPSAAPSAAFFSSRGQSIAPATTAPSASRLRARTPLFLPDDDDRDTPAPFQRESTRPPVPLFDDDQDDYDADNGGMMAFSQAMNGYNHLPAGAVEDDDDMDGAVYFGDADRVREL
ncbi:hypothetical protein C8R43DRAFT_972216 [Mycena crocata]|nr:hypothetical protein C8R43DRAFT_972216 [Mycena crocata]